jgi:hypothetical protein
MIEKNKMQDPRDSRYWVLQKEAKTTLQNLTRDELQEYLRYTDEMIAFIGSKKIVRKCWIELKIKIMALLDQDNN